MKSILSKHAEIEMHRRNIEEKNVLAVIRSPQQKFKNEDKWVYQSKYFDKHLKKEMLLRIFVKEDLKSSKVITLYKTSKINKYWRT